MMNIGNRLTTFFAAFGGAPFVSVLGRKNHSEIQMHKADLRDWENEGGNLAPTPKASDPQTTGAA
jgi:hypothetical protein